MYIDGVLIRRLSTLGASVSRHKMHALSKPLTTSHRVLLQQPLLLCFAVLVQLAHISHDEGAAEALVLSSRCTGGPAARSYSNSWPFSRAIINLQQVLSII
jgi:hypothetical protein